MRYLAIVTLALVGALSATTVQTQRSEMWVTIQPSAIPGSKASVVVKTTEMYIGGSSAAVGVRGQEANPAVMFSIRAWKEGPKTRVVVYAVLKDDRAPAGKTETPIATFALASGESIEVPQAEQWGGKRLTVTTELR